MANLAYDLLIGWTFIGHHRRLHPSIQGSFNLNMGIGWLSPQGNTQGNLCTIYRFSVVLTACKWLTLLLLAEWHIGMAHWATFATRAKYVTADPPLFNRCRTGQTMVIAKFCRKHRSFSKEKRWIVPPFFRTLTVPCSFTNVLTLAIPFPSSFTPTVSHQPNLRHGAPRVDQFGCITPHLTNFFEVSLGTLKSDASVESTANR